MNHHCPLFAVLCSLLRCPCFVVHGAVLSVLRPSTLAEAWSPSLVAGPVQRRMTKNEEERIMNNELRTTDKGQTYAVSLDSSIGASLNTGLLMPNAYSHQCRPDSTTTSSTSDANTRVTTASKRSLKM